MKNKKFTKQEAVEYLIKNEKYYDQYSGADMYQSIKEIFKSPKDFHTKQDLDDLLNVIE